MRLSRLWRITPFRLTALHGMVFAVGVVALLGMIYLQSAVYLTRRVDLILHTEAEALARGPPAELPRRLADALAVDDNQTDIFALFGPDGGWKAGNLKAIPAGVRIGGPPVEVEAPGALPLAARLIARRLPSGEVLVVGRDVGQLREMRALLVSALGWSGLVILIVGGAWGGALSIRPIRRLRRLTEAGQQIAAGDLKRRMPVGADHDELDVFARTVNFMMDEVERLMAEVKGATDTIAHDLRTPLTRARTRLNRLQQTAEPDAAELAHAIAEIDIVLDRFRALLRISELEARGRRAGFSEVDLSAVVEQAAELYQPLAEDRGLILEVRPGRPAPVQADPKLLFEAVSNLIDNALKFTPPGGRVRLAARGEPPQILVEDDGPGIPPGDRVAVLQRFYRSERDRLAPGSGLGLSIVAAIARLHQFEFRLEDAGPGLRALIDCAPERPRTPGESLFTGSPAGRG